MKCASPDKDRSVCRQYAGHRVSFCSVPSFYSILISSPISLCAFPFSPPLLPFSRWPSCRLKQGKLARLVRKSKSFRQRWSTRIRIGVLLETIVGCAQQSSKFEHPRCLFFLRFSFLPLSSTQRLLNLHGHVINKYALRIHAVVLLMVKLRPPPPRPLLLLHCMTS